MNSTRVRELRGGPSSVRVSGESRSEFERDYGRTVYSTPFRRLRDKAQVFPLEPNDSLRTRLLHSLEVSSVAEDIAAQSAREVIHAEPHVTDDHVRDIPLIAATCGLIHDLGNPPFGHAGELAISTWFQKTFKNDDKFFSGLGAKHSSRVQDFFTFEGNAQAIRIVSNVELLVHEYGLNFTAGTLAAAGKYLAASSELGKNGWHEFKKTGFFTSESEIFEQVRSVTGTTGCRHPITYFVETADDIVYCSVDLEDSLRRRILVWDDVESKLRSLTSDDPLVLRVIKAAKAHAHPLVEYGRAYPDALAQTFRVAAISELVVAARQTFQKRYDAIMNGEYHLELLMDPDSEARPFINACKAILRADVYRHADILRLEVRGRQVIHDLLDLFWEAVRDYEPTQQGRVSPSEYSGKLYLLLSENYRRRFEERISADRQNELYWKLRLITDQVSGMTDTYACRLHKDLMNG